MLNEWSYRDPRTPRGQMPVRRWQWLWNPGVDRRADRVRLAVVPMMTDRDVMVKSGEILAEHGEMTADYIIDQLSDVLDDRIAVEDWRRIAAAVDEIAAARPQ